MLTRIQYLIQADISRYVEEAKTHKEEDKKFRNASNARRNFEHYLHNKMGEFERNNQVLIRNFVKILDFVAILHKIKLSLSIFLL